MSKIMRTYGPIHFEDLDPHRFEDLIRELIYDYKDWQKIEATGRSGGDAGFDIRAYERLIAPVASEPNGDDDTQALHPMNGNRWMIQCKREKEIGPKKLEEYLEDVDSAEPPYGYILAAPTVFSKKSYDKFREVLFEKGVMEFYLWGKPDLEDMLHLPKNDRILFTFFGISLVSRRRSRSTEIRFAVNNKNKLYRTLGDETPRFGPVLLRDSKDDKYPYEDQYADFKDRPRWREYPAIDYHPLGLITKVNEHFAYVDPDKKEYDYSAAVGLISRQSEDEEDREQKREIYNRVEDFWDQLPLRSQARFCRDGIIRYDDMLVIDDKGDVSHRFPHIFVDFDSRNGPFAGFFDYLEIGHTYSRHRHWLDADWKRIDVFPKDFPEPTIGTVHLDRVVQFDSETLRWFVNGNESIRQFYDVDKKYDFLKVRDVIAIENSVTKNTPTQYIKITHKRTALVKDYLNESENGEYQKGELNRRAGRELKPTDSLIIFEFKKSYKREFDPEDKLLLGSP